MVVYYNTVNFQFGRVGLVWQKKMNSIVILQIILPRSDIIKFIKSHYPEASQGTNRIIKKISKDICNNLWENIPLELLARNHLSKFQRRVLYATRRIPRGRVTTYKKLAMKVGVKNGMRAVGQVLAKNPFPLVFPCHRVVKSDRSLGGFGGGIILKRYLLESEGIKFSATGRVLNRIW